MEDSKYFKITHKVLATALTYCGFKYMKFGDVDNQIYSFENTIEFRETLEILNALRKKNNKYIK